MIGGAVELVIDGLPSGSGVAIYDPRCKCMACNILNYSRLR